ncbi:hypothetical protein [Luteimonas sp. 3794]|uniref:hypothetical protein n=1 Tax=Luteimonas sp. 3794 TaxID=2817730 RepID=UPI002859C745|nr:hypothetical protein [Luteimonas sp. 3794]MDR6992955.1 hypothetical protein [Luteimonas sp. 3794]
MHSSLRIRRNQGPLAAMLIGAVLSAGASGHTLAAESMTCELVFTAGNWSLQHRTARGTGELQCSDGRSLPVRVSVKARGGDSLRIDAGAASFSGVEDPRDVIGAYVANGQFGNDLAMRKGDISLRVTGTGDWWQQGGRPGTLVIAAR